MKPYYQRDNVTLYCGECSQVMRDVLQDASIDLTITSPPYDRVDYDETGELVTIQKGGLREYNGYTWDFQDIARQLWRVTTKGGVVVWVVGNETENFCESLTEARQKIYFVDVCGFNLLDTMIYQKLNYPPAYPTLKRYANVFEYMLILSNGSPKTFNPVQVERADEIVHLGNYLKPNGKFESGDSFDKRKNSKIKKGRKDATNVWAYTVGGGDRLHPAPFPEALARDHVISWSNPGDLVLDPMAGSGTVLKVTEGLDRRVIGIEISEEYCRWIVDRIHLPIFHSLPSEPPPIPKQMDLLSE